MISKLEIREEQPADFAEVFEVNRLAFGQEDEARLVEALRKNATAFVPELSILAAIEGRVVGHILFTKIKIQDDGDSQSESLALAPMAVRPEFQRRGIGGQLIRNGLETARNLGYKSVIVLGHEHYYPKFGFEPAERWQIQAPFDVPSTFFMAIELVPDGLNQVSGTVVYPKEFESA